MSLGRQSLRHRPPRLDVTVSGDRLALSDGPATPDRRRLNRRWFGASLLVATFGLTLMAAALRISLGLDATGVSPAQRTGRYAEIMGGPESEAHRGDRLFRREMVASDREEFTAPVTRQLEDREIVRIQPFVRIVTAFSQASGEAKPNVPRFDPARLFAPTEDMDATADLPEADPSDAAVTITRSRLSDDSIDGKAPAMSDDDVTALVEEAHRLAETGETWLADPFAPQRMLSRVLGAARPGADFADTPEREDAPFRTIDVRIVPENVTTVPKTASDDSLFASRDLTLRRDQTLAAALKESGADRGRIDAILAVLSEHAVTGLPEGQHLNLLVTKEPGRPATGRIVRVTLYGPEGIEEIAAEKDAGGFVAVTPPSALPNSRDDGSDAEVGSGQSLYDGIFEAVLKNGLPQAFAEHIARIFGYTVDMQRTVSGSDRLELLYNPSDEAGALPDLLYASLTLNGEKHRAYRFETPAQGAVEYFDEKGGPLRRFLLRMPIAEGRVTSPFGTRIHPILHYARFHNGIDWANKAGTPIMSTGDGTVVFSGPRGGYGNRIEIRHANGYATAYNHMQRFSHAVHAGAHVRQGQVIGYMGSTGLSTGAHIHYEVSVNGRFLDPTKVRLPDGRGVPEPLMSIFERRVEAMNAIRHSDTVVSSVTPL